MFKTFILLAFYLLIFSQKVPQNCFYLGLSGVISGHSFFENNFSLSHSLSAKAFLYNFSCNKKIGLWANTGPRFIKWKKEPSFINNYYWDILIALQYRNRRMCLPNQTTIFAGINLATLIGSKTNIQIENKAFYISPTIGIILKLKNTFFIAPSVDIATPNPIKNIAELKFNLLLGYRIY